MLSKIQSTVLLLVGAAFAVFNVWNWVAPVQEEIVVIFVNALFALLAVLWPAKKAIEAYKFGLTKYNIKKL